MTGRRGFDVAAAASAAPSSLLLLPIPYNFTSANSANLPLTSSVQISLLLFYFILLLVKMIILFYYFWSNLFLFDAWAQIELL